ncbi:MAG: N-acetylmuramoyl-L-alanine amidase [Nitrospirota bacterium]
MMLLFPGLSWAGDCLKSEFILAIDIGHSLSRGGAMSARGISEYSYNRKFAEMLLSRMVKGGFKKTFLINPEGRDLSFDQRIKIAESNRANLIVSVHHDSVQPHYLLTWQYGNKTRQYSDKYRGFSIFYSASNNKAEESLHFAEMIGDELLNNGFSPSLHHAEKIKGENRLLIDKDRGIYRFDQLAMLKGNLPAVLLECGIIVNRDEEMAFSDDENKEKMVLSILRAIEKYCKNIEHHHKLK